MIYRWFAVLCLAPLMLPLSAAAVEADSSKALNWYDLDRALQEGRKQERVTLVFVHAKGCGPCRLMETKVFPQVRPILEQLVLARLDFADHTTRLRLGELALSPFAWAHRFGLEATPGYVLLNPKGEAILRESGLLDIKAFGLFLAYGSTGAYRHGSFAEYAEALQQPPGSPAPPARRPTEPARAD